MRSASLTSRRSGISPAPSRFGWRVCMETTSGAEPEAETRRNGTGRPERVRARRYTSGTRQKENATQTADSRTSTGKSPGRERVHGRPSRKTRPVNCPAAEGQAGHPHDTSHGRESCVVHARYGTHQPPAMRKN